MVVKDFMSQCSPELNAKILRGIENLVCRYRPILTDGWRCCIEFQRKEDTEPYYLLDLQSNGGGGDFAPIKMQTLRVFPKLCGTGTLTMTEIHELIRDGKLVTTEAFRARLLSTNDNSRLTSDDWAMLEKAKITHWCGGIRIPYDILVTDTDGPLLVGETPNQSVKETEGEIRIAFSGAKEWQDTFFCFCIFERIQSILNSLWDKDQIWYNLRGFKDVPNLQFWVEALNINEAPED